MDVANDVRCTFLHRIVENSLDQTEDMTVKKLLLVAGLLFDRWYVYEPPKNSGGGGGGE